MLSATGKDLMSLLKNIYNDHDFVCGAMSNAGDDEGWQEMIDFIHEAYNRGDIVTSDDILALSLAVGEKRLEKPMAAVM